MRLAVLGGQLQQRVDRGEGLAAGFQFGLSVPGGTAEAGAPESERSKPFDLKGVSSYHSALL